MEGISFRDFKTYTTNSHVTINTMLTHSELLQRIENVAKWLIVGTIVAIGVAVMIEYFNNPQIPFEL